MSPVKKLAPTGATVKIVQGMVRETHVADYIREMFEHLGVYAPFDVHVAEKIKGSEYHHGVECMDIKYNAVRMKVQTSDNGSRYLCYVRSPEMKPKAILTLLTSKLDGARFDANVARAKARKDVTAPAGSSATTDATAAPVVPEKKVSLAGAADDPEQVAMFFISIRLKHGTDPFDSRSFLEIMKGYAPTATRFTTGQLLRRIAGNGYLASEGKVGQKTYRFTEKGLALLAEHDKSIVATATAVLNIDSSSKLFERLQELKAKVVQRAAIATRILDLNQKIQEETDRIEDLARQIAASQSHRDELRKQAAEEQRAFDDPELAQAAIAYEDVQKAIKGVS